MHSGSAAWCQALSQETIESPIGPRGLRRLEISKRYATSQSAWGTCSLVVSKQFVQRILHMVNSPVADVGHLLLERSVLRNRDIDPLVLVGLDSVSVGDAAAELFLEHLVVVLTILGLGLVLDLVVIVIIVVVGLAHQVVHDIEPAHDFLHVFVKTAGWIILIVGVGSLSATKSTVVELVGALKFSFDEVVPSLVENGMRFFKFLEGGQFLLGLEEVGKFYHERHVAVSRLAFADVLSLCRFAHSQD